MIKKSILFLSILLFLTSCSKDSDERLKISTSTWIGYAPLFYAKEKGWLKELNIKLINVSSLSENLYLYKAGNSDAYTGTQYECNELKNHIPSLKPIILFDRSDGGDIILSNKTIQELQNTDKPINAYLEIDSINSDLLKYFINKHNLKDKNINYINKAQAEISSLRKKDMLSPTIIVTYVPYNYTLEKNGFQEIASTDDSLDLIVLDALFTTSEVLDKHQHQFKELKKLIDKSVVILHNNPQEFYNVVKPYMLDMSYSEFLLALEDVLWINKDVSSKLKERMNDIGFPSRGLL